MDNSDIYMYMTAFMKEESKEKSALIEEKNTKIRFALLVVG